MHLNYILIFRHMQIGAESCKIIFKNFGKLIKSTLSNQNIGVDIIREER